MGVIQGSINNLLTTAGIAARLSPEFEKAREIKGLEETISQKENLLKSPGFNEEQIQRIAKQQAGSAERIAELKPTKENLLRSAKLSSEAQEIEEGAKEMEESAKESAKEDAKKRAREEELDFEVKKESAIVQARKMAEASAQEALLAKQEEKRISESFRNWRNQ